MSGRVRAFFAACALGAAWIHPPRALAQSGAAVSISEPATDAFPQVSLLVAVRDEIGRQIPSLPPESFSVIEDDFLVTEVQVEEVQVGTRQVYVLNSSPGMKIRDSRGRTRFEFAQDALIDFWGSPASSMIGIDDLSLLTADGLLVQHGRSAAELAAALAFADPTFEEIGSGPDLLLQALDYASDPATPAAMPSHLIFITPMIHSATELPYANAIARAREASTSIHTVLMASEETLEDPAVEDLQQLAQATGGQFILFDPEAGFAFLNESVLGTRTQYRLTYDSRANDSQTHTLQVRVTGEALEAISPVRQFSVDVAPAQIVFIQPPLEILRASDDPSLAPSELPPTSQTLSLLITFPDGHPRSLVRSELIVDAEPAAERESPPFDQFEWDLRGYRSDGAHTLYAVVEDSLGLQSRTVEVVVDILVSPASGGLSALRPAFGSIIAAFAVLAAGLVLLVGLISLTRRRSTMEGAPIGRTPRLNPFKRASIRKGKFGPPEALLIPIHPAGDPVPLSGIDVVLGRDATLATIVLDDPSVDGLHARLIRQAGGNYLLKDQGSVAGTWVNYALVPEQGQRLDHGDILQLGRVELRFRRSEAPPPRQIRVYPAPEPLLPGRRTGNDRES